MRFALFIASILAYQCISSSCSGVYNNKHEEVILIFKDAPIQTNVTNEFVTLSTGDPYCCIRYIDSNLNICNFLPRSIGFDTISVPTFNGFANVYHMYKVSETIQYLFSAGDTVIISYNLQGRPHAESKVSENNSRYYNMNMQGSIIEKSGYSAWATLRDDLYQATFRFIKKGGYQKSPALYAKYSKAYIDLDSVEQEYNKCMDLLKVESKIKLEQKEINDQQYSHIISQIESDNKWVKRFYKLRYGLKDIADESSSIIYNDSLIYTLSYHYDTYRIANNFSLNESGIFQATGFDKVMEQDIPPLTKKIMLRHLFSQMDEYNASQYINKYIAQTGDSLYYNELDFKSLTNISHVNVLDNGYSNDFILKTTDGSILNYGELIKRNTGKVIYVDFWASWCAPCKREMPASIKLHEEYKDKDVIFIYLAYNDKKDEWKNAMKECNISGYSNNYIIINSQSAEFAKEIKLSLIPRFLLYNKVGKLISLDAPRPGSKEIKEAIDKLLKEK